METIESKNHQFQDGDFLTGNGYIMICKNITDQHNELCLHALLLISDNKLYYEGTYRSINELQKTVRHATNQERQCLLDALAKNGKRWNAEKKCIEDEDSSRTGNKHMSQNNNSNNIVIDSLGDYNETGAIKLLSHNIDKMLMDAIKIELEKIGHSFESNELFIEFCKTDLDFSIEQRSGHPLNKTIIVNSRTGELVAKFGLDVVINDSFRIEINLRLLN